jgi:hypothetical protein
VAEQPEAESPESVKRLHGQFVTRAFGGSKAMRFDRALSAALFVVTGYAVARLHGLWTLLALAPGLVGVWLLPPLPGRDKGQ